MKVTGVEEFGDIKLSEAVTITNDLFFEGVISLDVSTPSTLYDEEPYATQSLVKGAMDHTKTRNVFHS